MIEQHYDHLLFFSVLLGVGMLSLAMLMASRGLIQPNGKIHSIIRFCGYALMILPAGLNWYFSNSLIVLVAILLISWGLYCWVKQLRGR